MRLTTSVDVPDERIEALTGEAFRWVFEARGWWYPYLDVTLFGRHTALLDCEAPYLLSALAEAHHKGSTYAAFLEVEKVQALLEAVEAARRGWTTTAGSVVLDDYDDPLAAVWYYGVVTVGDYITVPLWEGVHPHRSDDPERAALEARKQLPRLVRIICGLEEP